VRVQLFVNQRACLCPARTIALRSVMQRHSSHARPDCPLRFTLAPERVNDFAPPMIMNLLRKVVVISG
jgi:hypothetical protein